MEAWMLTLCDQIGKIAGEAKLAHYQMAILPQILADFYKMLSSQPDNRVVREQYRMDDGTMEIELSGAKKSDGEVRILEAGARRM